MTKLYNPTYKRWEVLDDEPLVRNGEEVARFVSESEEACDAYMQRIDKKGQISRVLQLIERNGYVDRVMAAKAGVMELAARICDMESEGIVVKKTVVKDYDRDGKYLGYHKEYRI